METSAFSSEFTAMKHCVEDIECSRFKLRMFGVPFDQHKPKTQILCDNQAVAENSSNVESELNEKHSCVACHFTRWNVAAKVCSAGWIKTHLNIADAMPKLLPEIKRDKLFHCWAC